jgi:hypothetical protein
MPVLQTGGLSHSDISGSKVICTYPELNAAYHVLHRLHEPRHPPFALSYFLSIFRRLLLPSARIALRRNGCGWTRRITHTFSCIVFSSCPGTDGPCGGPAEAGSFSRTFVLLYSFACVNMSKISYLMHNSSCMMHNVMCLDMRGE